MGSVYEGIDINSLALYRTFIIIYLPLYVYRILTIMIMLQ